MSEGFDSFEAWRAHEAPGGEAERRALKQRAIALLARREHSRAELRRKLLAAPVGGRGRAAAGMAEAPRALPSPALVDAVLDELAELKLLSDRRMAESLVRSSAARFGTARISQNLQRKGVEAGLIEEALQPLANTETDRAREVWQRRFGQAPADMKARAKQYRFLLSRGFASSVVSRVVPSVSGRSSGDEDWDDFED